MTSEELAAPGPTEIWICHEAIGVNFIDVPQRRGDLLDTTPYRLGVEGAGIALDVGHAVAELKAGDRFAYAEGPAGS